MGLLILTLVAFALRLGFSLETEIEHPIRADARQYVAYGHNLAQHGVFSLEEGKAAPTPDSIRSPGFPLLIAATMLAGGERGFYPLLLRVQATLSSLLVPLTFLMGMAFLPAWGALIAAALIAFEPHLVATSGYVLTETLFSFLLLAGMTSLAWAFRARRAPLFLLAGAGFGLAYLVTPTILPFPFLLAGGVLLVARGGRKALLAPLSLLLLPLLLCWGAWTLRNTTLPPGAGTAKSRAIITVVHGSYPNWTHKTLEYRFFPYREDEEITALTASWSGFLEVLSRRVAERPWRYLSWYLLEKPVWLWTWNELQAQGDVFIYPAVRSLYRIPRDPGLPPAPPSVPAADATRVAMKALHWPLVLLCLGGLVLALRRRFRTPGGDPGEGAILASVFGILVFYTLLLMVFAPLPRYATPLRPYLFLGAAWTASTLLALRGGPGRRGEKGPGGDRPREVHP